MQNSTNDSIVARVRRRIGAAGPLFVLGTFVAGIIFWGGFNTGLEATNTEEFCISCHEMRDNVYPEYHKTIHYQPHRRARHLPGLSRSHDWTHKLSARSRRPSKCGRSAGKSTRRKNSMPTACAWPPRMGTDEGTDSRECRNCHNYDAMSYPRRESRSPEPDAFAEGKTCIDCHKGIAHTLPAVEQNIGAPKVSAEESEPELRTVRIAPAP